MKVVLFDFDGTLSAGDCNIEFYKYCLKHSVQAWLFLPLALPGAVLKLFNKNGVVWRQIVQRAMTKNMVKKLAPGFIKQHRVNRFGWAAEQVAKERADGNFVICISASADFFVRPLVRDMAFDAVIATRRDAERPWIIKFLCYGPNKIVALDRFFGGRSYQVVRAYSDSKSDMPIMRIATEQVWIDPKTGARRG